MKKHCCAECGGKLGLGVRFRNLWDGFSWSHLRFCSARCEEQNEIVRRSIQPRRSLVFVREQVSPGTLPIFFRSCPAHRCTAGGIFLAYDGCLLLGRLP